MMLSPEVVLSLVCATLVLVVLLLACAIGMRHYRNLYPAEGSELEALSRSHYTQRSRDWMAIFANDYLSEDAYSPKFKELGDNFEETDAGDTAGAEGGDEKSDASPVCTQRTNESYIDADIPRTFPQEKAFSQMKQSGSLRRVLLRVSCAVSQGYVQGMNELAAVLLLHFNEEDSVKVALRLLYTPKYSLIRVLLTDPAAVCEHFDAFLVKYLPNTAAHFAKLQISSIYFSDWFKTVFLHVAPLPEALVVFDAFVQYGWVAVYRTALHILTILEPEVLQTTDIAGCVMAIRRYRHDTGLGLMDWAPGTARTALAIDIDPLDTQWMMAYGGDGYGCVINSDGI
eukprot:TRINITY_DN442_c0_g2_i1.p2 TRINITY_DN442_c0_g2~~TRINITY_DN442_c0_g2_i1.p2  ORF type:complete len:342 (+),score=152.77 TRINITY_DN442_c0_g2_i1:137-1162(+)